MKKIVCIILLLQAFSGLAANKKVTIDVQQMTCPLCVISINQALRGTEGVIKAKASMKTKQAQVVVAEGFDTQRLLNAIARTGFTGVIHDVTAAE